MTWPCEKAQRYCQNALFGVALVILEESDNIEQHTVTVPVMGADISQLRFVQVQDSEALFRLNITDFDTTASCYQFKPMTADGREFFKNLCVRLDNESTPYLAPLQNEEAATNPAFLVCGFSYGSHNPQWKTLVESILIGGGSHSTRSPLLSPMFTRLIMGQWQFMRIDEAAKQVRFLLQDRNTYYADYAHNSNEARPHCARTRLLENQLQEMHSLNTQAQFILSRIQGALQTLEINGDNLANHLQQIRRQAQPVNAQLQFQNDDTLKRHWQSVEDEVPLLAIFQLSRRKLQDHQAYIEQQVKYLDALRDKWLLYLNKRKSQLGEYLNTLGTVLIFLLAGTTGVVTLNVNKGILGLNFEDQRIYLVLIAVLLTPILWRFITWIAKGTCCIFHGTWLNRLLCRPVIQWTQSMEFFSWFKKR